MSHVHQGQASQRGGPPEAIGPPCPDCLATQDEHRQEVERLQADASYGRTAMDEHAKIQRDVADLQRMLDHEREHHAATQKELEEARRDRQFFYEESERLGEQLQQREAQVGESTKALLDLRGRIMEHAPYNLAVVWCRDLDAIIARQALTNEEARDG